MKEKSSVLVTGGAGYIGSHTLLQLAARGERVVVLDDLSTGFRQAVRDVPLVVGNVGDRALVDRLLAEHNVDTIIHFAAHTIVPESVSNPLKYYGNNTCATRSLLEAASQAGVKHFVFSSTGRGVRYSRRAAWPQRKRRPSPSTPTARRSSMSEWMLRDVCAATPMRSVALRYFNVAGCDTQGRIGQSTARRHAAGEGRPARWPVGKRPHLSVFGTDYPTPGRHRACAITSTSRTWPRRTSTPSPTCATAASRWSPIAATGTVTACAR
jgi:UDP-glucose 4-epimerase